MRIIRVIFLSILSGIIISCSKADRKVRPSIYHWKQEYAPTNYELNFLKRHGINKIYLRFFDIKFTENKVVPVSTISFIKAVDPGYEIVPVVYIDNTIFKQIHSEEIQELADKIYSRIKEIAKKNNLNNYKEIQIDCDWTKVSKEKYFNLIKELKSISSEIKISVTLRLHQLKYRESAGIPPADRVSLMYYNMSKIDDIRTTNSILDNSEGEKYLTNYNPYPIPLDIALPIFEWSVLFQKNKLTAIFTDIMAENIGNMAIFRPSKDNRFVFDRDTVIRNIFVRKGDLLRLESINFTSLSRAGENCADIIPEAQPSVNVTLFSLDSTQLTKYDSGKFLENIFDDFR